MVVGGQRGMERQEKWRMSTVSPARVMSLSRSPLLTTSAAGSWHGNRRGEPFPGRFGRESVSEGWRGRKRDRETERWKTRADDRSAEHMARWHPLCYYDNAANSLPTPTKHTNAPVTPSGQMTATPTHDPLALWWRKWAHPSHTRMHARTHTHFPKGPSLFLSVKMKTYIKFYHSINQSSVHTVLIGSQRCEL